MPYIGHITIIVDGQPKGNRIGYKSIKQRSLILKWAKAKGAEGYQIYITEQELKRKALACHLFITGPENGELGGG